MISIQQLSGAFDNKRLFKNSTNIKAEKLLIENLNGLINFIEGVKWKLFAGSDKFQIFPAVGTITPRMFQLLHVSYELFKRGYEGMSYSLLRTMLDHQDLLHLFFKEEKWAALWYSDDNITSAKGDLAPRKVRGMLGKSKADDLFILFSKYVHPTSRDADSSFFALVDEDGEEKSARLDVKQPIKSLHMNLGSVHSEGNDWLTMMFLNMLGCRLLNQLDVYLKEFTEAEVEDIPLQCIGRLGEFLQESLPSAMLEFTSDADKIKQTSAGILVGCLGDSITLKMLNNDPEKISKLRQAMGISKDKMGNQI
jgi:hypothetical protein